ncbi:hypothetical protein KCP71_11845 [Salmonella enterica subsp. enterica]|nr:hypothetical protein KCP71_11845 [Salmonella enterica subsp. enterica]
MRLRQAANFSGEWIRHLMICAVLRAGSAGQLLKISEEARMRSRSAARCQRNVVYRRWRARCGLTIFVFYRRPRGDE